MRKWIITALFALFGTACLAQQPIPNVSYNANLNAACTNANTSCPGAVYVTGATGIGNNGAIGTGPTLDVPVGNYNAATITVSGTYTGATINFDFTDPGGTNYFQEVCARTDINLLENNEVLPSNQVRAYNCPVWANSRFRVRISAISTGSVSVWVTLTMAAIDPSLVVAASITNIAGASDPCQDVSAPKSSVVVNISTATTTQFVALSGTTSVYVCGFSTTFNGTTPTLQFEYGTGATCGTGTTVLTGTFAPTTGGVLGYALAATAFKAPAGNALCGVSTGTTPSIQGVITYVQQ